MMFSENKKRGQDAFPFERERCCEHPTNNKPEANIYPQGRQFSPRLRAPLLQRFIASRVHCKVNRDESDANSHRSKQATFAWICGRLCRASSRGWRIRFGSNGVCAESGVSAGVLEHPSKLRVQVPPCLALLCAAGEHAVCAWIPSGVLEDARRQSDCLEEKERHPMRAQTKALGFPKNRQARQKQAFGLFREASIIAKAGERVARWLNETRGSELRKAKSTESALRSLAHVSEI